MKRTIVGSDWSVILTSYMQTLEPKYFVFVNIINIAQCGCFSVQFQSSCIGIKRSWRLLSWSKETRFDHFITESFHFIKNLFVSDLLVYNCLEWVCYSDSLVNENLGINENLTINIAFLVRILRHDPTAKNFSIRFCFCLEPKFPFELCVVWASVGCFLYSNKRQNKQKIKNYLTKKNRSIIGESAIWRKHGNGSIAQSKRKYINRWK